ncbi:DUF2589 domain-containing protein [Massilia sp. Root335]|jgi:hypothetical protein|uniref:DUF2589 domain-containing protein n=1 Tax=Massilia sp. Root335 TaxID=1736517 RepID=UPI0009EA1508|nr:DUF2589 domain-containing protein [Massilia sp. Root335]
MAILTSLEDMVRAVAGSIMNAQHMVEKAQLANIATFFDDAHRPTTIDVELPAIHSTAPAEASQLYRVPVLSLVPHGSLVIGEAEIDLDVELGPLEHQDRANVHEGIIGQLGRAAPAEQKAGLMINPSTGGLAAKQGNAAHIKLKLVAVDKSEGLARLLNDVVVTQGPVAVSTPAARDARVEAPPPAPDPAPDPAPADDNEGE